MYETIPCVSRPLMVVLLVPAAERGLKHGLSRTGWPSACCCPRLRDVGRTELRRPVPCR